MMNLIYIDVREPEEYSIGHIKDSINIPLGQILSSTKIENIPKDTKIVVYCRGGVRAEQAKRLLKSLGYTNITNGINKQEIESNY